MTNKIASKYVVAPGVTNTRKIRGQVTGLGELGRGEWLGRSVR